MNRYVLFLKGVNVGGKNVLPMKQLVSILESVGCQRVSTYIQSGNAVFDFDGSGSGLLAVAISGAIEKVSGIKSQALVLEDALLEKIVCDNPFPEATEEPAKLHVSFYVESPKSPDYERLESVRKSSERYVVGSDAFYLHAPDGVGRSKLASDKERLLGAVVTDRNWNTVMKMLEMARGA